MRFLGSLAPSAMAGGFFLMAFGRAQDPALSRLGLLFLGGLFGIAMVGLIRLFRIAPWGYPWAGLFCGLVPPGLFFDANGSGDDRAGFILISAILGVLIGLLEWARVRGAKPAAQNVQGAGGPEDGER